MSSIDLENLLTPVEQERVCGPSLVYDPVYLEVERLAQGTPQQQMGDSVIAASEPNWMEVSERTIELLGRSKDLRLLIRLAKAQVETRGLAGLHDATKLLRETLQRYWDQLHPQLDPEDDNDPLERMNIIASIATPPGSFGDDFSFVHHVRAIPLTNSRRLGPFSLRDVAIANGDLPPPVADAEAQGESQPPADTAMINAAFDDTETEELVASAQAAEGALEQLHQIGQFLTETVGPTNAPDLTELERAVKEAVTVLKSHLRRRGAGEPGEGAEGEETGEAGPRLSGEIGSREDVLLALDKVCRYYEANEPSSPIPLLLRRAQRLVAKSFVEIVKDLTPGAISEIETIGGQDYRSTGESS